MVKKRIYRRKMGHFSPKTVQIFSKKCIYRTKMHIFVNFSQFQIILINFQIFLANFRIFKLSLFFLFFTFLLRKKHIQGKFYDFWNFPQKPPTSAMLGVKYILARPLNWQNGWGGHFGLGRAVRGKPQKRHVFLLAANVKN